MQNSQLQLIWVLSTSLNIYTNDANIKTKQTVNKLDIDPVVRRSGGEIIPLMRDIYNAQCFYNIQPHQLKFGETSRWMGLQLTGPIMQILVNSPHQQHLGVVPHLQQL